MLKEKSNQKLPDRPPAVSGRFYPASDDELRTELDRLFSQASKFTAGLQTEADNIRAIIVPHAGYVFSGTVAAAAYLPLLNRNNIRRVFIIGSSHHAWFEGASVYYESSYITPLGNVEVDRKTATGLLNKHKIFGYHPQAHISEHTIEVQLPFLQYTLKSDFTIIPIVIGGQSKDTPRLVSDGLKPFFSDGNLFVISTDLSHYPEYSDAVKIDKLTVKSICANDPEIFIEQLKQNEKKKMNNLATSICGWTSVLTLLNITSTLNGINFSPVLYQNSGDIALYGEKSRVVGYQSILISARQKAVTESLIINDEEKKKLLLLARESIINNIKNITTITPHSDELPRAFNRCCGVFVSVYVNNSLRGCIGRLENDEPLYTAVGRMAVSCSSRDYRFAPIKASELDNMHIEISLLTPLKKIGSIDEIIPGKHGILIKKGSNSGTFLPQVALKTGWNTEEMLSQCSERKAGLGPNGWKEAEIFIYEAVVFNEKALST
jgi:AmmeMemoRadiSam system protein B/AmmeMemoRadiSam system protein A